MNDVINITFNEEALDIHAISVVFEQPGIMSGSMNEDFLFTPRVSGGQIQMYDPLTGGSSPYTGTVGEYTAIRFKQYFELDYNSGGFVTVAILGNTVTLTIASGFQWVNASASVAIPGATAELDISYTLGQTDSPFQIVSQDIGGTVGSPCNYVKLTVETNLLINNTFANGTPIDTDYDSVNFGYTFQRGLPFTFTLIDYDINIINIPSVGITGVYLLDTSNINISVTPTGTGITVNFTYVYIPINGFIDPVFEWSLDGITYQSSSVFTGQTAGTYTIYMKDQFNCVKELSYTLLDYGARNPYKEISIANSINYVLQEDVDNCETFRNQDNSFNYQGMNAFNYCESILFNTCDNIRTQVKTNYSNLTITLRNEVGVDVNIVPIQRSLNLDRFQSLDGVMYNYAPGLTGLYFDSGNTYNELGAPIGTYILNGNLPTLAMIGNLINIEGYGGFLISDITFDKNVQKNVIIIQNNFVSLPEDVIVSSTFDLLEFEVYEFDIDWSIYGEGLYDVVVLLEDDNYPDACFISENICIKDNHENTLAIRYFNDNNKDIFYKYGIEHFIRIPYLDVMQGVKDESTINIGDYVSELVYSSVNIKDSYMFDSLPPNIRTKLIVGLSCKYLFINNIGYIKSDNADIEHEEFTNMAYVQQTLIRTNVNYNTSENTITVGSGLTANFPVIITDGTDFIKR